MTKNGPTYARMLAEMADNFGPSPRKFGLMAKSYHSYSKPSWANGADQLIHQFKDRKILMERGHVVWGALIQANEVMFKKGSVSAPGAIVLGFDPALNERPDVVIRAALILAQFKGETAPTPELQRFGDSLADEYERLMMLPIPRELSQGFELYYTCVYFPRAHLEGKMLHHGLMPYLVLPRESKACTPLPAKYWTQEFRDLVWYADPELGLDPFDGEPKVKIITKQAALDRLKVLYSIHGRAVNERAIQNFSSMKVGEDGLTEEEIDENFQSAHSYVDAIRAETVLRGIIDSATPQERAMISAKPGTWEADTVLEASWILEGLAVLEWAMSLLQELPEFSAGSGDHESTQEREVEALIGENGPRISDVKMRPADDLMAQRSLAQNWYTRARAEEVRREGEKLSDEMSDEQWIGSLAHEVQEAGHFKMLDGDFPAFGKAFRDLDMDEVIEIKSLAYERLYMLNWICGWDEGQGWEHVPVRA